MKKLVSRLVFVFLLSSSSIFAQNASVEVSDLEVVTKSNPAFRTFFVNQIDLANEGMSSRLGRHFGALAGKRVGPYEFPGRFKGDPKEGWPLRIVLHATWHIEDDNGKNYGQDPPPAEAKGPRVVEYLERVEIISVLKPQQDEREKARAELEEELEALREKARELGYDIDQLFKDEKAGDPKGGETNGGVSPQDSLVPQGKNDGFFANKLEEGDTRYAAQYYCDEFLISMKKGQVLQVTYRPEGYIGEALSGTQFSGDLFRSAGPQARGTAIGEELQFEITAESDVLHIIRLMTRDKDISGSYRVRFVLDGQTLSAPENFPAAGGEGNGRVTLK